MAMLFMDPCGDDYAIADATFFWTSTTSSGLTTSNSSTRYGVGYYINHSGAFADIVTKTLSSGYGTLIVGFAFKVDIFSSSGFDMFSFTDAGSKQCSIKLNGDGTLSAVNGAGTVLGTSSNAVSINTWYFIEFKVLFHGSTGTAELRVNGTNSGWLNLTGKNTKNTSNTTANGIKWSTSNSQTTVIKLDDIYCCDTSGSVNNNFLGDFRIECLAVTGAGTTTQLTPSTGSNYQNVDEGFENGDTDYNSSSTAGQFDTYAMADLATTPANIYAVQEVAIVRKDDGGTRTGSNALRSGSTNYFSTAINITSSYAAYTNIRETDPNTSAAWAGASVNALEAGYEIVS
jgi:hypothetical protein